MKTRFVLSVVVAGLVFAAIFGFRYYRDRRAAAARAAMPMPAVTVSATAAQQVTWPQTLTAVGTCASFRGIVVKTELEGAVRSIRFESGAVVAEGALLVELDTSVETAQLAGLEAQARLAAANLTRAREVRSNGTNTPVDLDTAEATLAHTRSAVDQLRATIAKKRIVAPFAGRLGIRLIHPGQFLGKGESIVQLEALDPIHVDFTLPQQELARVAVGQVVHLRVDAHGDRLFKGAIDAIAPRVNDATRTLTLRATVPNKDAALLPGMFGSVQVILAGEASSIALPTAAIVYNPYGNFVYVVEKGVVQQRFVQLGAAQGNRVAILSGVKPGEQVVTSGQIKLRNGSPVQVDNTVAPSANPAPAPKES